MRQRDCEDYSGTKTTKLYEVIEDYPNLGVSYGQQTDTKCTIVSLET